MTSRMNNNQTQRQRLLLGALLLVAGCLLGCVSHQTGVRADALDQNPLVNKLKVMEKEIAKANGEELDEEEEAADNSRSSGELKEESKAALAPAARKDESQEEEEGGAGASTTAAPKSRKSSLATSPKPPAKEDDDEGEEDEGESRSGGSPEETASGVGSSRAADPPTASKDSNGKSRSGGAAGGGGKSRAELEIDDRSGDDPETPTVVITIRGSRPKSTRPPTSPGPSLVLAGNGTRMLTQDGTSKPANASTLNLALNRVKTELRSITNQTAATATTTRVPTTKATGGNQTSSKHPKPVPRPYFNIIKPSTVAPTALTSTSSTTSKPEDPTPAPTTAPPLESTTTAPPSSTSTSTTTPPPASTTTSTTAPAPSSTTGAPTTRAPSTTTSAPTTSAAPSTTTPGPTPAPTTKKPAVTIRQSTTAAATTTTTTTTGPPSPPTGAAICPGSPVRKDCQCDYKDMKDSDRLLAVVITKRGGFKGRRINSRAFLGMLGAHGDQEIGIPGPANGTGLENFVFPAGHYYFPRPIRFGAVRT